jgi:hypothetical protein
MLMIKLVGNDASDNGDDMKFFEDELSQPVRPISAEKKATLARDGFVVMRGLFTPDWQT